MVLFVFKLALFGLLKSEVRNLIPYVRGYLLAVDNISVGLSGVGNVGPSVLRVN